MDGKGGSMLEQEIEQLYTDESIKEKKGRWVTVEEGRLLLQLATTYQPDVIFESGTANGLSAAWMYGSGRPIITFDPIDRMKLWERLGVDGIEYVRDKFSSVDSRYPEMAGWKKLFFIDGEHTSSGVLEDIEAVKRFAKLGDMVVFHDTIDTPIIRAIHRLKDIHALTYKQYCTARGVGVLIWQ
jgi:predicted O-methyltransferase YrrM